MKFAKVLVVFASAVCIGTGAVAQIWPAKPVQIVVPYSTGGMVDTIARILAPTLSDAWGQAVVVENEVGGGGALGTEKVAKSAPDGHTLLLTSNAQVISPALRAYLPYDPLRDFVPIAPLIRQAYVLVVGKAAGITSVAELVAQAKAKPGAFKFTSAGIGTGTHLMAEKFNLEAGLKMVHVPTSGGADSHEAVISGRMAYWFAPITSALPLIREGRLLALGVSGARRMGAIPEVPTVAEAGIKDFDATLWFGVWAPVGTPAVAVYRIALDLAHALAEPDVRERLAKLSAETMRMMPAEFAAFVRDEARSAQHIVKVAGIPRQ